MLSPRMSKHTQHLQGGHEMTTIRVLPWWEQAAAIHTNTPVCLCCQDAKTGTVCQVCAQDCIPFAVSRCTHATGRA